MSVSPVLRVTPPPRFHIWLPHAMLVSQNACPPTVTSTCEIVSAVPRDGNASRASPKRLPINLRNHVYFAFILAPYEYPAHCSLCCQWNDLATRSSRFLGSYQSMPIGLKQESEIGRASCRERV